MTTHRAVRTAVVTIALALATTVGASATVLVPAVSTGGAGGGGGFAFDAPTQNERSIQMIESTQTATGALAGGESQAPQASKAGQVNF